KSGEPQFGAAATGGQGHAPALGPPRSVPTLTSEAMLGKPIIVRFDAEACKKFNLGTINCGADFWAEDNGRDNPWAGTGVYKAENAVKTVASTNADRVPGSLSVWGMISRFDDDGNVFYLNQKVGRIELQTERTGGAAR